MGRNDYTTILDKDFVLPKYLSRPRSYSRNFEGRTTQPAYTRCSSNSLAKKENEIDGKSKDR